MSEPRFSASMVLFADGERIDATLNEVTLPSLVDPESVHEPVPARSVLPAGTYGRIWLSRDFRGNLRWTMGEVSPHVALRLKSVFPRLDKTETFQFVFDDAPIVCADLDWFLSRYPMAMSVADRRRLTSQRKRFQKSRDEIETILLPEWRPAGRTALRADKAAFAFQEKAIEIAMRMRRLLVLDEGGMGKTITGTGILVKAGLFPAAVVVQAHLATQWAARIREFSTLRVHVIDGTRPYDLPEADVYVFRYSNIGGWVDIAAQGVFRVVVFDEIQELRRGDDAQKGKAGKVFASHAAIRIGLTATPIYNYGDEIFNVIELIEPGLFGSVWEFRREWCVPQGQHWVVKNPAAMGTYLREQTLAIRRTYDDPEVKAELGDALPQPNRIVIDVPYDEEVEASEVELCRSLAIQVTTGSFTERGQAARDLDMRLRRITGIAKARHVAAYVRLLLSDGDPVLLAGWHRDVYAIWLKELADFAPVLYTGTETPAQKDKAKAAFVAGRSRVMMISLRSGSGLDGLQAVCNTLVVGEFDWSPLVHDQLIWRLRRLGQQRWPVNAIFCHANGGADPVMAGVLGLKASQSRGITDPLSGPEVIMRDASRIKLLAQRYLEMTEGR